MNLWELPDSTVQNQHYDFELNPENYPESTGSMSPEDILHYAYLTMRFIYVNGDCETENIDLVFDGAATYFDDVTISQGGHRQNRCDSTSNG